MQPTQLAHVYRCHGAFYVPTLRDSTFGYADLGPVAKMAVGDTAQLKQLLLTLPSRPKPVRLNGGKDERLLAVPLAAGFKSWRPFEKVATLFVLSQRDDGYHGLHVRRLDIDNNHAAEHSDRTAFGSGPREAVLSDFLRWITEIPARTS